MDTKRSGIPAGSTSEWCVWGIQESEDRVRLVNLRLGQSRFIPVEQAAAAPDLLEALRALVESADQTGGITRTVYRVDVDRARAAIAKAEGR